MSLTVNDLNTQHNNQRPNIAEVNMLCLMCYPDLLIMREARHSLTYEKNTTGCCSLKANVAKLSDALTICLPKLDFTIIIKKKRSPVTLSPSIGATEHLEN